MEMAVVAIIIPYYYYFCCAVEQIQHETVDK